MVFRDALAGAAMIALSLVIFIGTWHFSETAGYAMPRLFPRAVAVILMLFSAILLVRSIMELARGGFAEVPKFGRIDWRGIAGRYRNHVCLTVASFIYIMVLEKVGYVLATVAFLALAAVLFGERKWTAVTAFALIVSLSLYGTFRLVFDVPLPRFDLF